MQQIQTIVFDLGGVLVDWNPMYLYRKIFSKESEAQAFLENVCTFDWNEEQDAGRSLADATQLLLQQFPEQELHIKAYYTRWEEMLGGPIEGTVEIFSQLKRTKRYKIVALTNWSAGTFPKALARYDFLHWFDGRLVSGEENTRKPFPEIYEALISKFDLNPATSLFIDDNERNLIPAKAIGFNTIHFKSPEILEGQLKEMNLL
jgi:2-haloacid dehalogenase